MEGVVLVKRPPLGIAALASCAGILGFTLSFSAIAVMQGGIQLFYLLLFAAGVLVMLSGVDFYNLRKWAWWFAVVLISVSATFFSTVAIAILIHLREAKEGSTKSAVLFLGCYPFL